VTWTLPSLAWITAGYENSIPTVSSNVSAWCHESPSSSERASLSTPLEIVLYAINRRPSLSLIPSIPNTIKGNLYYKLLMQVGPVATMSESPFLYIFHLGHF
jgi:hypothetical protein